MSENQNLNGQQPQEEVEEGEAQPQQSQPQQQPQPQQPQIQYQPPEEFGPLEAYEPLIELFGQLRGVPEKAKAAHLFFRSLRALGYTPDKEQGILRYLKQVSDAIQQIPDTPETAPVKGAVLQNAMLNASRMLEQEYGFGDEYEMQSLIREMRPLMKMAFAFKMLDRMMTSSISADQKTFNPEFQTLTEKLHNLERRIDEDRRKQEEEERLKKIIGELGGRIEAIKEYVGRLEGRLETVRANLRQQGFSEETIEKHPYVQQLRQELKEAKDQISALKELLNEKRYEDLKQQISRLEKKLEEKTQPQEVTDIKKVEETISSAIRIANMVKGKGGEEAISPATAAITSATEIGKEFISILPQILGKETKEEAKTAEQHPQIDETVLSLVANYCARKLSEGEKIIDPFQAAQELYLTPAQVVDAIEVLKRRGTFTVEKVERKQAKKKAEKPSYIPE